MRFPSPSLSSRAAKRARNRARALLSTKEGDAQIKRVAPDPRQNLPLSQFGNTTVGYGIYSNNAGNPGDQLFDFGTRTTSSQTAVDFTFTPGGSVTLLPSTIYHLRINYVSGDPIWIAANPDTTPSAQNSSGIVFQAYRQTTNGGATYSNLSPQTSRFQLNGAVVAAVVPEAGTLAFALPGLALGGVALVRRKRNAGSRAA